METPALDQLVQILDNFRPRVVCHPVDEASVRKVLGQIDSNPKIEINEWAVAPGQIMVFRGGIVPTFDLGVL